jgi:hypothetical protein
MEGPELLFNGKCKREILFPEFNLKEFEIFRSFMVKIVNDYIEILVA